MEDGRVVELGAGRSVDHWRCRLRSGSSHVAGGVVPQRQSADERAGGDRAAHVAEGVDLGSNQLTSVPATGQLTSLEVLGPPRQSA